MLFVRVFVAAVVVLSALPSLAQDAPFGSGWRLEPGASSIQFSSIKNQSVIETSSFATLSGNINATGAATVTVLLDSVDTKVDLRNVRMRFLFFETFLHPEATVTTQIAPELIADLSKVKRKTVSLPIELNLHGVKREEIAQLSVILIGEDLIAVSSAEPLTLKVADYDLMDGLQSLEEAASVSIVPSTNVNFDLIFKALPSGATPQSPAAETPSDAPVSVALEAEGDFSLEACAGRFEILSRSGNIYFRPGSARLNDESTPLLTQVADIVARCPDLKVVVAGHTDNVGSQKANQRLSERRAAAVVRFLTNKGINSSRLQAVGHGEERPIADNATKQGRSKNRRIEFSVADS
ncbi:OmpA family protein [Shimia sagamensis]|uniref:Outer membrane protein OmpA n=1 Tax=Shimia sagamensis TaxID=1566352 RepID=A0ABY1N5F2_9RHOB|nr:OmpA family protein [Shimia sagamensis]SMP00600.1 Outer membrane protein OmpA [Shimia sagamensis]